jgi:hypothetical protein
MVWYLACLQHYPSLFQGLPFRCVPGWAAWKADGFLATYGFHARVKRLFRGDAATNVWQDVIALDAFESPHTLQVLRTYAVDTTVKGDRYAMFCLAPMDSSYPACYIVLSCEAGDGLQPNDRLVGKVSPALPAAHSLYFSSWTPISTDDEFFRAPLAFSMEHGLLLAYCVRQEANQRRAFLRLFSFVVGGGVDYLTEYALDYPLLNIQAYFDKLDLVVTGWQDHSDVLRDNVLALTLSLEWNDTNLSVREARKVILGRRPHSFCVFRQFLPLSLAARDEDGCDLDVKNMDGHCVVHPGFSLYPAYGWADYEPVFYSTHETCSAVRQAVDCAEQLIVWNMHIHPDQSLEVVHLTRVQVEPASEYSFVVHHGILFRFTRAGQLFAYSLQEGCLGWVQAGFDQAWDVEQFNDGEIWTIGSLGIKRLVS